MSPRKLARRLTLFAWLPLALVACGGASFDEPSVIKGLRIIAVQKNPPYPKADSEVDIRLAFWDAKSSPDNPRTVNVFFSPNVCENPPGDLYYNCFSSLGFPVVGTPDGGNPDDVPDGGIADSGAPDGDAPDGSLASASSVAPRTVGFVPLTKASQGRLRNIAPSDFIRATAVDEPPATMDVDHIRGRHFHISPDIIRPRTGGDPYGLAYVLFAVCPGQLAPVLNAGDNALPLGCFDETDHHQYGADDFVIGYTSMYVYNDRENANPIVNDILLENVSIDGSTTDDTKVRHVPSCKASDRTQCQKFPFQLDIDRSSAELNTDPTARTPDGMQLHEQMWVAYYTTGGTFKSSLRLVNDATTGWNDKNDTEYTAPAEAGPVRLFGVVHDNRGGVTWKEGKIIVDE